MKKIFHFVLILVLITPILIAKAKANASDSVINNYNRTGVLSDTIEIVDVKITKKKIRVYANISSERYLEGFRYVDSIYDYSPIWRLKSCFNIAIYEVDKQDLPKDFSLSSLYTYDNKGKKYRISLYRKE